MKEKSCGAIVYKKEKELKFLIVHQHNGHHSFPKGHIEDGETEIETAKREIKEETNLDVEIDINFRYEMSYIIKSNVTKEVVYFLATPSSNDLKSQEGEILDCNWYSYNKALDIFEYDNYKEALKAAYRYINEK